MTLYIIYAIIILVIIILYFLVKDKKEFLNKLGITTIIAGIIILVLGIITNIVLDNYLNNFNITKINALILQKFIYNSAFLLVLGLVEVLTSKIIQKKKKNISPSNS